MSVSDEHERAIEFARGALARARAHARTAHRSGWRPSRARGASQRWGVQAGEAVYSGATADRRDPAPLGAALSELISLQGWSEALTVAGVTSRWADIVGADVAEHVCVEAFEVGDSANSAVRPGKSDVGDVSGTALESLPSGTDTRTSNSHSTPNESVTADAAPEGASKSTGVPSGNLARIVVRADSTAWATQLRLLLPALRRRIADDLGVLADRSGFGSRGTWQVEVTVLAPSAPSWRKGPRHVSGRGPRDTYG